MTAAESRHIHLSGSSGFLNFPSFVQELLHSAEDQRLEQSFKQSSLLITYYHGLTLRSFRPTSDTQYKSTPSSKIRSISWRAPRGRMGTAVPENQHLGVQQSRRKSDGTDSKPNLTATGHIEWTNILAGKPSTPDSSSWQQILILKLF